MRITVLALGTRGDVQPVIALALGLQRAGHTVRVAAPPLSRDLVAGYGLEFASLGELPKPGPQISLWQAVLFTGRITYFLLRSLFSRSAAPVWPVKTPDLDRVMDDSLAACEGADAIVFPHIAVWMYHIVEKMRVPGYVWDTHPLTATREFPSFSFTGIFPAWFSLAPGLPAWFRPGGGFNTLTHRVVQRLVLSLGLRLTNAWRVAKLQLPALTGSKPIAKFYNESATMLYAYSPLVVPPPADWPPSHHVTGYWFADSVSAWQPSEELLTFLSSGPPPVCVGFGSARDRNPKRLTETVAAALAEAGCRGLILTGRGGLVPSALSENLFAAESIPHDWLFPRMAAVVHHGGAGTCGAVLRAGVPSVVVPWWGDMHFWADRLHKLGVSPRPVPKGSLSARRLAVAIRTAVGDSQMRARAIAVAKEIQGEDGVSKAVRIIDRQFRQERSTTSSPSL